MAAAEFMGQALESRIRYVYETLKTERKRHQDIDNRGIASPTPPWLDSCIYQIELGISDLEGSRIAARTLKATVQEVLDILATEEDIAKAMVMILDRFQALLRAEESRLVRIDDRVYRYNPSTGTHEGVEDEGQG